jgi:hypothetical protein
MSKPIPLPPKEAEGYLSMIRGMGGRRRAKRLSKGRQSESLLSALLRRHAPASPRLFRRTKWYLLSMPN